MSCFDASHLFGPVGSRRTTIFGGEEYTLVANNKQKADGTEPEQGYCAHWEVERHRTVWDDYDACVAETRAKQAVLVKSLAAGMKPQHLWGRNTGIHGVAFCAMETPSDIPDDAMVLMMGRYIGERCVVHKVNPRGILVLPKKYIDGESLVTIPGEFIKVPVVFDHCTMAEHDGYGPSGTGDRWDVGHPKVWGRPSLLPRIQAVAYATYDAVKRGQPLQLAKVMH